MHTMQTIVIISELAVWEQAQETKEYIQSTLDSTLSEVGFIHCSFPDQTMEILNRKFTDRDGLVLLLIDVAKVTASVKFEAALSGRPGTFPHIYGPMNIDAVYAVVALEKDGDGSFITPPELVEAQSAAGNR
jgi:uncharacterized protein (DUF952 family)